MGIQRQKKLKSMKKRSFTFSLAVIMALSMVLMSSASVCSFADETEGDLYQEIILEQTDGEEPQSESELSLMEEGETTELSLMDEGEISVTQADFVSSVYTISAEGTYVLSPGVTGTINIDTTDEVTVRGTGCDPFSGSGSYYSLSITGIVEGVNLTVENLYIQNANDASSYLCEANGNYCSNILNFTGSDNVLTIAGVNDFEATQNGAAIHVDPDTSLEIGGTGTLYIYKTGAWTCIGGNGSEANGEITINGGNIFAKGSKMGAVIGTGSYCPDTPGNITINGGMHNFIANARGALIGNGATDSNSVTPYVSSGLVTINGGSINCNVDWTGAAVGASGNNAGPNEMGITQGDLVINGGSLRVFIDKNSYSRWGLSEEGVSTAGITAQIKNSSDEELHMLSFDTSQFEESDFSVKLDGTTFFNGGLHQYCFANETLEKASQNQITNTTTNWISGDDSNLYLFLTATDHELTVNDTDYDCTWDEFSNSFELSEAPAEEEPEFNYDWYYKNGALTESGNSASNPYIIYTKAQLKALAALVNGTYEAEEVGESVVAAKSFEGKYFSLANDISVDADGKYTAVDEVTYGTSSYNVITTQYAITADAEVWSPIGTGTSASSNLVDSANYFAGTFDGNGHKVSGIYTPGTQKVQGLFGCVSGSVKNLTVSGCITSHSLSGGIAAYLNGGTIENCINEAIVFSDGGTTPNGGTENGLSRAGSTGGVVGRADGNEEAPFSLIGNTNRGTVICANSNKGGRVGGIVGLVETNNRGTLSECVNYGAVEGYQYSGGIAGMIATDGADIESCANMGRIEASSPGSTYVGGIVAQTKSNISYCFNTGNVHIRKDATSNTKVAHAGGIVSDFLNTSKKITNCYNSGLVTYNGYGINTVCTSWGTIVGTGYGSKTLFTAFDCLTTTDLLLESYPLTRAEDYNYVVNNSMGSGYIDLVSETVLGSEEGLALLNGDGRMFVADTSNINGGLPILRSMISDNSTVDSFELISPPEKLAYVSGQSFDTSGMVIRAKWSDGSYDNVPESSFVLSETGALDTSDTSVSVSGTWGGQPFTYSYPITVEENNVVSINVDSDPTYMLYAKDEVFNPEGMTIEAEYTNGLSLLIPYADGVEVTDGYTYEVDYSTGIVTVEYEYNGNTVTCTLDLTILSSPQPQKDADEFYLLECPDDMLWFSFFVGAGNLDSSARVTADIDLTETGYTPIGTSGKRFGGEFDGGSHTVTLNLTGSSQGGALIGYASGADIHDVNVSGTINKTSNYNAGVVAYAVDSAITDCTNEASITSTGNYTGGITSYAEGCTARNCVNYGEITGSAYVGGISGDSKAASGDTSLFSECGNEGNIVANTTSSYGYAGGIIGNGSDASGAVGFTVEKCYNTAGISGIKDTTGKGYVGGIAGQFKTSYIESEWSDLYNTGTITGNNYFGGIAGYLYNSKIMTLSNAYNSGTLTSTNGSSTYVGAVAGRCSSSSTTVLNSYYLDSSYTQAQGSSSSGTVTSVSKTSEEMMAEAFVENLGASFKKGSDYPILAFQETPGYEVTVINSDSDNIIVSDIPDSVSGHLSFTVSSDNACVVTVEKGGTTEVLSASPSETAGTYEFSDEIDADTVISIMYKGDINGDGEFSLADINVLLSNIKGTEEADEIVLLMSDANGDGIINIFDVDCLVKALYGVNSLSW